MQQPRISLLCVPAACLFDLLLFRCVCSPVGAVKPAVFFSFSFASAIFQTGSGGGLFGYKMAASMG